MTASPQVLRVNVQHAILSSRTLHPAGQDPARRTGECYHAHPHPQVQDPEFLRVRPVYGIK